MKKYIFISGIFPILFGLSSLRFLPNKIPIHYDIYGNVDRFGTKFEILVFPFAIFLISLFWIVLIRYYKRKILEYEDVDRKDIYNQKIAVVEKLAISINLIYNFMNIYFILTASGYVSNKNINSVMAVFVGVILIFSGMIIRHSKKNSIIGIRTKWSMSDDVCWKIANDFGGKVLVFGGILIIVLVFFNFLYNELLVIAIVLIIVAVILLQSYVMRRKK